MASQQLKRETKNEDPKVASRFESVMVKESGKQPTTVVHQVTETIQGASLGAGKQKDKPPTQGDVGSSLEEISKYRGMAQQNSMEAIRAAQEKYEKSKDNVGKSSSQQTKNYTDAPKHRAAGQSGGGLSSTPEDYSLEKSSQEGRTSGLIDMTKKGASYVGDAARTTRDVTMETGKTAAEYMGKGEGVVRDAAVVGGWKAAEFAGGVTDSVKQVGGQATDVAAGLIDTTVDVSTQGAAATLETGTTAAQYVGKVAGVLKDMAVVAGWNATKFASDTAAGAMETMEDLSGQAAAGAIDTTVDMSAKWTSDVKEAGLETGKTTAEYARMGAGALKDVASKSVDMSKQGASFVGETGKDVTLRAVKTTAEYAGKAAGVLKDAAVVAGWNTAEFASKKATDAKETLEDVAAKSLDTTYDMSKQGASFVGETVVVGKDATLGAVKATSKAAGVLKDAAIVAGWDTAEFASDKAAGAIETMGNVSSQAEDITAGVIEKTVDLSAKGVGYAGETATVGKDLAIGAGKTTLDISKKGGSFVGETAIAAKDVTLGAVKTTAEYAVKAAGVLKDVAVVGGWNTAEFASNKAADAIETMGDVSSQAEDVTAEIIDRTVDISDKGVNYIGQSAVAGKDLTFKTGKTTAEYARKGAGALKEVASGLMDTTLDMGQKAESRASGGVRLDINNQTRDDTTKGVKGVTDRGGFEHQQPEGLIVEGHFMQKGPGGVKEQGNFKLQESGGVVEGSLEHRGTGDTGAAMRMIGKTLMDAGDDKKDSKVRRGE